MHAGWVEQFENEHVFSPGGSESHGNEWAAWYKLKQEQGGGKDWLHIRHECRKRRQGLTQDQGHCIWNPILREQHVWLWQQSGVCSSSCETKAAQRCLVTRQSTNPTRKSLQRFAMGARNLNTCGECGLHKELGNRVGQ